jgi:hypothetical protein
MTETCKQRGRGRKRSAAEFVIACIRLYPWETGEKIAERIMFVAPGRWSKLTLMTVLSRLYNAEQIISANHVGRVGKDVRSLVYALPNQQDNDTL